MELPEVTTPVSDSVVMALLDPEVELELLDAVELGRLDTPKAPTLHVSANTQEPCV